MAEKIIDVCGEICPDPLTSTMKAMDSLASGDRLKVMLDSPNALETITRWAQRTAHKVVAVIEAGSGQWELTLEKA